MSLPIGNAVHHIAVIGTNYEASRHFYVDVLGFEVVREVWREEKQDWKIDLALDGCELELFILPKAPAQLAGGSGAAAPGFPGEERGRGRRPAERPGCSHRADPPGPLHPLRHDLFPGPGRPAAGDSRVTRRVHRHFEALNCKRKKQISKALPSPYGSGKGLAAFLSGFPRGSKIWWKTKRRDEFIERKENGKITGRPWPGRGGLSARCASLWQRRG